MKKLGLKKEIAHDRTAWCSAIHGNEAKLCKHEKCDVKRIDKVDR